MRRHKPNFLFFTIKIRSNEKWILQNYWCKLYNNGDATGKNYYKTKSAEENNIGLLIINTSLCARRSAAVAAPQQIARKAAVAIAP